MLVSAREPAPTIGAAAWEVHMPKGMQRSNREKKKPKKDKTEKHAPAASSFGSVKVQGQTVQGPSGVGGGKK